MAASPPPGYTEWPAPAPLRHAVACLWAQVSPERGTRDVLVLPDGCSDLIWEQGTGAYLAGPDTGPAPVTMTAGTVMLGVRFRPAAGGAALGVPLSDVRDQRVDLGDLHPGAARRLPAALDPATAAARILDVAGGLIAGCPPDPAVAVAVRLLAGRHARAEDVAAGVGLSMRQLRRRCHAAVGYGPKTLHRVLRFRRFVSVIDSDRGARDGLGLSEIAAHAGYADQAHLTRECRALSGLTPTALIAARRRPSSPGTPAGMAGFLRSPPIAGA